MQRWKKKPLGRFKSMSPSKHDLPVVLSLNQQKGDASRRSPERSEDCQSWDFLCKSSSACHQNSDFCSLKTTRVDRTKIFLSAIYYIILSINHLSWFPLGILSKKKSLRNHVCCVTAPGISFSTNCTDSDSCDLGVPCTTLWKVLQLFSFTGRFICRLFFISEIVWNPFLHPVNPSYIICGMLPS